MAGNSPNINDLRHRTEPGGTGVERRSTAVPLAASLDDYTSADEPMQRCLHLARLAARTELPVLVLGESGTGKTVISQAIHHSSARAKAPTFLSTLRP